MSLRLPPLVATNPGRPLDQPQAKKHRACRPGQLPPANIPGQSNRPRDAGAALHGPQHDEDGGDSAHRQRMEKRNEHWDERRAADVDTLIAATPALAAQQAVRRAAQVAAVQTLIDTARPLPCRPPDGSGHTCSCNFELTGSQAAVFHDIGGVAGSITVGVYRCSEHSRENVTVHPFQVGCVPTSPIVNTIWLSLDLVEQFRLQQLSDGVGGHGYMVTHNLMAAKLDPLYGHQPGSDSGLRLNDEVLQEAAQNLSRWRAAAREQLLLPLGMPTNDPFGGCFVCAKTDKTALEDGTKLPDYPVAIMLDACTKAARFSSSGRAQQDDPKTNTYLAGVGRQVLKDVASGTLTSEAKERHEKECAAAAAAGAEGGCSSNLSCSRASASTRGVVDVAGVAGVFCAHGQPALDGQLAMRTPEQWAYHIRLAISVLSRRSDVEHLYIDIACRIGPSLRAALQELVDSGDLDPEILEKLKIMVPWMHAFDHNLACQREYSGMYTDGVGRRIGEQSEHHWSRAKAWFLIGRYMTFAHWWDGYNAVCALLSELMQQDLPQLLEKKLKNIDGIIGRCQAALHELREAALADGVEDLAAAHEALEAEVIIATPLSTEALYVETLMKLRGQLAMCEQEDGIALLLPGNKGVDLHAQGTDLKLQLRLRDSVVALEMRLQILPQNRWKPGQPCYDTAAVEVARKVCREALRQIQDRVFKLKLIKQDKAHETGKPATKLLRDITKQRGVLNKQLAIYLQFKATRDGTERMPLTEDLTNQVYQGEFPWIDEDAGGAGSSTAATHHYARQYFQKLSQLHRSQEEHKLLRTEILRTFNCLEERQAAIQAGLSALKGPAPMPGSADATGTPASNAGPSGAAAAGSASSAAGSSSGEGGSSAGGAGGSSGPGHGQWPELLAAGQLAALQIELQRIQLIHADAKRRLTKYRG